MGVTRLRTFCVRGLASDGRVPQTTGWRPTCRCEHNTGSGKCLVLDPFMGSGTVGAVARRHSRHYLGIELNQAYIDLARDRIAKEVQPVLWSSAAVVEASA